MINEILKFLKKHNRMSKVFLGVSLLTVFILYSLLGVIYKNYKVNRQIKDLKKEIVNLKEDNIEQKSKILYYDTDAYIEKTLREKLGYIKEGEKVYALPRSDPEREKLIREQERRRELEEGRSNIVKWWDFFFKES